MNIDEFNRLANNFYHSKNIDADSQRLSVDVELLNFINTHQEDLKKQFKVAFVFICLNPLYWQFANEMVQGARKYFLPGHKTEYFFWTDIPESKEEIISKYKGGLKELGYQLDNIDIMSSPIQMDDRKVVLDTPSIINGIVSLRSQKDIHIIPTVSQPWPYPTLMRYNLFLQQEEKLKEYDYIFYCDTDMVFANIVGDEILGPGLTGAPHPGYALRKEYYPPYEPNELSACYIPRPGRIVNENGKQRFRPEYYAGGLQGGKSKEFIKAMKAMKEMIEKDLAMGYVPIWNDETAWNKYLSENPPSVMLDPSYIYPDSLINEYYVPLWGRNYLPRLITITKWFSLSKEGGQAVQKMIKK